MTALAVERGPTRVLASRGFARRLHQLYDDLWQTTGAVPRGVSSPWANRAGDLEVRVTWPDGRTDVLLLDGIRVAAERRKEQRGPRTRPGATRGSRTVAADRRWARAKEDSRRAVELARAQAALRGVRIPRNS